MSPIIREVTIGDCRLIQGDCLEVMPLLGKVDAVITSPPYGQQRDYGKKISNWRDLVSGALLRTPAHEHTQILCNLGLIHKDGAVVRYWDDLIADMEADAWRLFGWYVWDQLHGQAGEWNGRFAPTHEWVFHFNKASIQLRKNKPTMGGGIRKIHGPNIRAKNGQQKKKSQHGKLVNATKIQDSIIRTHRETGSEWSAHPARFPVKFALALIDPLPSHAILDPFMGSGTTLVACAKLGRKGIGIELDADYFDIAVKRVTEAYAQPDLFIEPPKPIKQEAMDL